VVVTAINRSQGQVVPTLETAIRLFVIGQEFLIAAVFLFSKGGRAARMSGALLVLSIVGYLYTSDIALRNSIPLVAPVAMLLALIVPYCLWLFARAIFEAPWPGVVLLYLFGLIGIIVWLMFLLGDVVGPTWANAASVVMHLASLVVVAHALWITLRGRPDDLIEHRRTFRLFFVAIIAFQIAAVLVVELTLAGATPPAWLELANLIIIAIITFGLAIPMLRLNAEFFGPDSGGMVVRAEEKVNALGAAENVLRKKLLHLMDEGYYRETGLTIRLLAKELKHPEHQLRRLINGHLGYRNFSAFLNGYRIDEAMAQLVDPERARVPVLTIALELGYGSLGPFNRSFKARSGMTPTEYRQGKLG